MLPSESSDILRTAHALPKGAYLTPGLANVADDEAIIVGEECLGVTNATSVKPVIGTNGYSPCTAIIAYNNKRKIAVTVHYNEFTEETLNRMLKLARNDDTDWITFYVAGLNKDTSTKDESFCNLNQFLMHQMEKIAQWINSTPYSTLAVFDVFDKPKPNGIAIDTRTGKLIRGSKIFKTPIEFDSTPDYDDLFIRYSRLRSHDFYDGTTPDKQRQRNR